MLRLLLRSAYLLLAIFISLFGGCAVLYHIEDKIYYADLRANESASAVKAVRDLGEEAEAVLKKAGRVPTTADLNCYASPCTGIYFIERDVSVDASGIIHATYHKFGVPFTPTSQFDVSWNSRDRATNRDYLREPWQWRLLSVPWLLLSLGVTIAPWIPIFIWRRRRRAKRQLIS